MAGTSLPIETSAQAEITKTKVNPNVLSDTESEVETNAEVFAQRATDINVLGAFIFCPTIGSLIVDRVLEQGIFVYENELSDVEGTRNYIPYKFFTIMVGDEDFSKSKPQAVQDYLNGVCQKYIDRVADVCSLYFLLQARCTNRKLVIYQCRESDGIYNYFTNRLGASHAT